MDTKGQQGQVHNQVQPTHYLVEEEYVISVPMMRPKQPFLDILRLAGATGEAFTRTEIIGFLRDYISSRRLFDIINPRVVNCGDDQLGQVFDVTMFTVDDVLGLLDRHCISMPDTCLKRKRHLVSKPFVSSSNSIPPSSFTIAVCQPVPQTSSSVISSTTSSEKGAKCVHMPYTKTRKSSSSSNDSSRFKKSCKRWQRSAGGSSVVPNDTNNIAPNCVNAMVDPIASTVTENEITSNGANKSPKSPRWRPKSSITLATDNQTLHNEAPGGHRNCLESETSRPRKTSLSISYGDNDGAHSYPWYFKVEFGHNQNDDDTSEVLSVQDKETATVCDSTDDLWFLEEDSIAVEVPSDADLSVEYDIDCADESPVTESDMGSVRSGEGLLVVCQESDVEFFADYSDTDTDNDDKELSEADNWTCTECLHKNMPLQRYCDKCWKLKKDWLPNHQSSQQSNCVDNIKHEENVKCDLTDSGMGSLSSMPTSSQEADVSISKLESEFCDMQSFKFLSVPLSNHNNHSCFIDESKNLEMRHSYFNRQSHNKSSSSSSLVSDRSSTLVQQVENSLKSVEFQFSGSVLNEPCMICLSKPKNASLVHGSSGHQVCCFACAKRLKRRGKCCPICRRRIQKVVKNYIL